MSVYGGDSWGREAQYRKRRVDDLLVEKLDGSSYKKLSGGKYVCLVCRHNPILDTPLMLSLMQGKNILERISMMHVKGSQHRSAESMLKEKEVLKQIEINKRIALSGSVTPASNWKSQICKSFGSPLIEQTRKATSEIIYPKRSAQSFKMDNSQVRFLNSCPSPSNFSGTSSLPAPEACHEAIRQHFLNFEEQRERELKFTSAGWKRDCHGKWFRDENVEFDSDEEDPNISL